jgi:UDP-N-acetylmuramate: L-alanyl-gamma-D-glutamyl-meso-diaminopimelate ligase
LMAVLELHTFSSLNAEFMQEYKNSMEKADDAIVFYSNHALELKRMRPLDKESVFAGFQKENLEVITDRKSLEQRLAKEQLSDINFLFMSSGNYDGMNILKTLNLKSNI